MLIIKSWGKDRKCYMNIFVEKLRKMTYFSKNKTIKKFLIIILYLFPSSGLKEQNLFIIYKNNYLRVVYT